MMNKGPYLYQGVMAGKQFHTYLSKVSGKETECCPELTVHSVFRRVLNLAGNDGILSLVTPGVGKSAGCLVVDLPVNIGFTQLGIEQGMAVNLSRGRLVVDDLLAVDCHRTVLWAGREPSELIWQGGELTWPNLKALHGVIIRYGKEEGLASLLYRSDHPLAGQLGLLAGGLINPGAELLEKAVRSFIGLGPGLTPSGDDLLLGLLAAVGTGLGYRPVMKELQQAVLKNLGRTNDLSAHFLLEAIKGNYHEYVQEVIYAYGHGTSSEVTRTIYTLLGVGATSGSDIATGLYLGFYWQYRKRQLPVQSVM